MLVLVQEQDGHERVIAYASRGLRPAERNYPIHKLEFLALKWSVTDKFHDYLYGNTFVVHTDNNPLTYVLSTAKLDATQHRWVAELANYNFSLQYKTGKTNCDADGLSRNPVTLYTDAIKAICMSITANVPPVECLAASDVPHSADDSTTLTDNFNNISWLQEQQKDETISRVTDLLRSSFRPREEDYRRESKNVQKYLREWNRLYLADGILFRTASLDGQPVRQIVIPETHKNIAFQGIHSEVGHPGKEKSVWLARQRFYWPGLETDIEHRIETCPRCVCRKTPVKPMAPLLPIITTRPMQLVCIDFLKVDVSKGGYEDVLVITDHFTRYAKAIPCRKTTALATAKALYEQFIVHFSFPEQLHSDQGRNFDCKLIKELCNLANVKKTRTTPYHPAGNGSAERFNRTLLKMLGTLEEDQKADWKTYIGPLVQAYNATKHDSTGYSPHFLFFGWHPRISVDSYLGTDPNSNGTENPASYITKLQERMEYAYKVASNNSSKRASVNKDNYDKKVKENKLEVGDIVLVRKVGLKGRHKLADKWEREPYVIVGIPDQNVPVYQVQLESTKGPIRTLHRNFILPFVSIPAQDEPSSKPTKQRRIKTRAAAKTTDSDSESSSSSSEDDRYEILVQPYKTTRQGANLDYNQSSSSVPNNKTSDSLSNFQVDQGTQEMSDVVEIIPNTSRHDASPVPDQGLRDSLSVSNRSPQQPNIENSINFELLGNSPGPAIDAESIQNEPVVLPPRPARTRRPPDRYGQWVMPHIATNVYYV